MDRTAVQYATVGALAVITLDRPAVRNAVDGAMARDLADAFRRFDADAGLAVAVLTGAAGQFCAGADLKAIARDAAGTANRVEPDGDGPMGPTRMQLSKPVIAAIEGHAVAGGLELAIWCDLRVASRSAILGVFCRRFGVPLVDGGTVRLPRLVGHGRAMDLILTGREVSADEALRIGLVDRVVEDGMALEEALKLARDVASHPQTCLRSDRLSACEQWGLPLEAALRKETQLGLQVLDSGETVTGAQRFLAGAGRHGTRLEE
jgi:enoyl-CoA hydratase